MTEQWREIRWRPGYEVSTEGRIRHGDRELVNRSTNNGGYLMVCLGKKNVMAYVHRLVAEAFVENPNGYDEIDHIDGDKRNNRADNLEWVTRQENLRRAWKRHEGVRRNGVRRPVVYATEHGVIGFANIEAAARVCGISSSAIKIALRRGSVCFGGVWRDA